MTRTAPCAARPGGTMRAAIAAGEALEVEGRRFALGVQWHPEADEASPLIAALVEEARAYAAERAGEPEVA